ncbi:MAG: hypothetical protein B7733_24425 [Myxococcales bacterium FL481]|nr:MAG: hypothetical protein B7733_24425 [Myxococcales bacterium FL481]
MYLLLARPRIGFFPLRHLALATLVAAVVPACSGSVNAEDSLNGGDDDDLEDEETAGPGPFADITSRLHEQIDTLIVVEWTQEAPTESSFVEYSFDGGDDWLTSPKKPGLADGHVHQEYLFGVPEGADVEFRIIARDDGKKLASDMYEETNGEAPEAMPRPIVEHYDPDLASEHRWMLGAVSEKGEHGYGGPHWIYIVNRDGDVTWYYRPIGGDVGQLNQGFWPRLARDGTHITIDRQHRTKFGSLLFTTLDLQTHQAEIDLPFQQDCYDVTPEGSVLYNNDDDDKLYEVWPDGDTREVWECPFAMGCYSNTVNYDPASGMVFMSFPYPNTVARIDLETGEYTLWGDLGDWTFEPSHFGFDFNHWPNMTPQGTFMVSSHLPGTESHRFMEFEVDEAAQTLRRIWDYGEGTTDWAEERGMVARVPGGNAIANYGPTGIIVEVTPDQQVAWRIVFPDRLLGNNILIDDLHALNRGPQG